MDQTQIKNLINQIKKNNSQMFTQQSVLLQAITDMQNIITSLRSTIKRHPEILEEANFEALKNVLFVLQNQYRHNVRVTTNLNKDFLSNLKAFAEHIENEKTQE